MYYLKQFYGVNYELFFLKQNVPLLNVNYVLWRQLQHLTVPLPSVSFRSSTECDAFDLLTGLDECLCILDTGVMNIMCLYKSYEGYVLDGSSKIGSSLIISYYLSDFLIYISSIIYKHVQ